MTLELGGKILRRRLTCHTRVALAFSIYTRQNQRSLTNLSCHCFRDKVPVKRSFAEIKEKKKRNYIYIYVYMHKYIYICINAKIYIFNREYNSELSMRTQLHIHR